jgi:PAS domain S-box-containing protein
VQQQIDLCSSLEAKLEIAEKALSYSNDNIQLTMQIWIEASEEIEQLLVRRADNSAKITTLIEHLREQFQSDDERKLLDAATPRWGLSADYGELLHHIADGQSSVEVGAATANVMLPLLLDNASWKAFVEFLRAQLKIAELTGEGKEALTNRTRQLVRQNQMLKSIVAERQRLEERLSQLSSLIECANDAIVICTLGGTIVSWNMGAEAVYGYPASEVLGRSRYILVSSEQPDQVPQILERLKREEKIQLCEAVHIREGGKRIRVSMSFSPVKDGSGKMVGFAAITREIRDPKAAARSRSRKRDKASI